MRNGHSAGDDAQRNASYVIVCTCGRIAGIRGWKRHRGADALQANGLLCRRDTTVSHSLSPLRSLERADSFYPRLFRPILPFK